MTHATAPTPSTSPEEARPIPPRFRWLKRLSIAGVLLVIAMAGLRWWWGWEAQRRIDALIASVHAQGKPILLEDFVARDIPDADSAAIPLRRAEGLMRWTATDYTFWNLPTPYSAADLQLIPPIMQNHQVELKLLRDARGRKDLSWDTRIARPVATVLPSRHLTGERGLAQLLQISAMYEHSVGNDRDAIEHLRDLRRLGEAEMSDCPMAISLRVTMGVESIGLQEIIDISPSLAIADSVAGPPGRGATRTQIKALIAELLDERSFREGAENAWVGEAAYVLEVGRDFPYQEIHPRLLAYLAAPAFWLETERLVRQNLSISAAVRAENLPAAKKRFLPSESSAGQSMLNALSRPTAFATNYDRIIQLCYAITAERRAAATMLALRLFAQDHAGNLPESLNELIPTYLAAVPLDPLAPGGRPLAYLPHRNPPAIYSVGYNSTDEGGSTKSLHRGWAPGYRWDSEDGVFPLR